LIKNQSTRPKALNKKMYAFAQSHTAYKIMKKGRKGKWKDTNKAMKTKGRSKKYVKMYSDKGKHNWKIKVIDFNGEETEAIYMPHTKDWLIARCEIPDERGLYALEREMAKKIVEAFKPTEIGANVVLWEC